MLRADNAFLGGAGSVAKYILCDMTSGLQQKIVTPFWRTF